MTIPLKNWIVGAVMIIGASFAADFFFIHYLFPNKRDAQMEKYNEGVVEVLNNGCDSKSLQDQGTSSEDPGTSGSEKLEQCAPLKKVNEENQNETQ